LISGSRERKATCASLAWAELKRYPGDYHPVSEDEYERALGLAGRVLHWVREQITVEENG